MKTLLLLLLLLSHFSQAQLSPGIDSLEYNTISPQEFCTIFSDSVIQNLSGHIFLESANHSYEELLQLALAWNTRGVNSELLDKKGIHLCDIVFSEQKRAVWERFYLYIDDFWGHDTLFFDNGKLCLRQANGNPIFPYYRIASDLPDLVYMNPQFKASLKKEDGISKAALLQLLESKDEVTIHELFDDFQPPKIEFFTIGIKDGPSQSVDYITGFDDYVPSISFAQYKYIKESFLGQLLIVEIVISYPNEANFYVTKTIHFTLPIYE